jgi:outer membrane protein assembly factor BamD (BamD/ComL family)
MMKMLPRLTAVAAVSCLMIAVAHADAIGDESYRQQKQLWLQEKATALRLGDYRRAQMADVELERIQSQKESSRAMEKSFDDLGKAILKNMDRKDRRSRAEEDEDDE